MVPLWYHFAMAMNLRLTRNKLPATRAAAQQDGISMQEAARPLSTPTSPGAQGVFVDAIARVAIEDAELSTVFLNEVEPIDYLDVRPDRNR